MGVPARLEKITSYGLPNFPIASVTVLYHTEFTAFITQARALLLSTQEVLLSD
jgi:hypothetical protein